MFSTYDCDDTEYSLFLLKQYQEATDHSVIVSKTNTKGMITYVNNEFCRVSEYSREELLGQNHNIVRHPDNPKSLYEEMWNTIKNKKQTWQGMLRNYTKSGGSYYVKTTIKPILDKSNNVIEYIALRDDITDIMSPRRQLNDLLDSSTEAIVILIRIEGFDDIENFYGQKLTHTIEENFADELLNFIPKSCSFNKVYILGNGEYAFAQNSKEVINNIESVIKHLKELQQNINDANINIGEIDYDISVVISVSYGENSLEDAKHGMKELIRRKQDFIVSNGFAQKEHDDAEENIKTIKMVKNAIDNVNIISYFQPIINNKTKEIEKYESLVRLVDEYENIISPFAFLDVAKKGRYYPKITSLVLENSFDALNHTDMDISINISVIDIEKKLTRVKLIKLIEQYKDDASRIILELLEGEEVKNFDIIKSFISKVKVLGVKIAVDDFGSGYSNFARLLEYQPDIIKIDGSLVKNIEHNKLSLSVVKTIVAFAKDQNLKTVAEYVENENIFNILNNLGVDYSQGYYFGKPQPLN